MSDTHLSSSHTHSKLNGDSGINMSPPPVNLKTHPSLKRRKNEGNGSAARCIQRSVSQDASQMSSLSHTEDDLQFSYGCETPSPKSKGWMKVSVTVLSKFHTLRSSMNL